MGWQELTASLYNTVDGATHFRLIPAYAPSLRPKAEQSRGSPTPYTHTDGVRKTLPQFLSLASTQDGGIPKALHNSVGPDKGQVSRLNTARPHAIILKYLVPLLSITQLCWKCSSKVFWSHSGQHTLSAHNV